MFKSKDERESERVKSVPELRAWTEHYTVAWTDADTYSSYNQPFDTLDEAVAFVTKRLLLTTKLDKAAVSITYRKVK